MKKSKITVKIVLALALIACLGMVLAACGDKEETCTVTIMDGDNVYATESFAQGQLPNYLPSPPTGKVFAGLYTDAALSVPATAETFSASSVTLYVKWETAKYTVVFFGKDGEVIPVNGENKQKVEHGSAAIAPEVPDVYGYEFQYWDKSFDNVTSNRNVNAVYEAKESKMSFVFNGKEIYSDTFEYGHDLDGAIKIATSKLGPELKEGFMFEGWYLDPEFTKKADASATMDAKDTVYYAKDAISPPENFSITCSSGNRPTYTENLRPVLSIAGFRPAEGLSCSYKWYDVSGAEPVEIENANGNSLTLGALSAKDYKYRAVITVSASGYEPSVNTAEISIKVRKGVLQASDFAFASYTGVYDGIGHSLVLSGVRDTDTVYYSVNGGDYSSAAPTFKNAGTYAVNVKIQRANYEDIILSSHAEISKKDVTFGVVNKSVSYGSEAKDFELSVVEGALAQGDNLADFGSPVFTHSYQAGSPAAEYGVSPSGLSHPDYNVSYASGTLTVVPAKLIITIKDASVTYGDARPEFSAEYAGFVNGEDVSVVKGSLDITCDYAQGNNAGNYTISFGSRNLSAANYEIEYAEGVLTVLPRPVKITADNAVTEYGDDAPAFTAKIENAFGDVAADSLANQLKYECAYDKNKAIGNFEIIPSGITDKNYVCTYVNGKLSVSPRKVTVTVGNASVIYGNALDGAQGLVYTAEGLYGEDKLGDGEFYCTNYAPGSPVSESGYELCVKLAENENYAVTYVNGILEVTPRAIGVRVTSPETVTYGEDKPQFGFDITSGELFGEDSITAKFICDYAKGSGAGKTFAATASFSNPNYAVTVTNASFTVIKADLTVTAVSAAISYGDALPSFQAVYTGFVNGENATVIQGTPVYACDYSADSPEKRKVGEYKISVSGLSSDNYEISYVGGALTVNKTELVVKADDLSEVYGTSPEFTIGFTGFAFGETESVLTGAPKFDNDYAAGTVTGIYAVTIAKDSYSSDNYEIKYLPSSLTVTKKAITLNVDTTVVLDGATAWTNSDWNGAAGLYGSDKIIGTLSTSSASAGVYTADGALGDSFVWTDFAITNEAGTNVTDCYAVSYALRVEILDSGEPYKVNGVNTTYDGKNHSVTVTTDRPNRKIEYSADGNTYSETSPVFKNAGAYKVYYRISAADSGTVIIQGSTNAVINKKDLTITANPHTAVFSEYTPYQRQFSASYAGFVEGEDESVLTGTLVYSFDYKQGDDAGKYPVTPSGVSSPNYNVVFVAGTLTVDPKEIGLVFEDETVVIVYGEETPEFAIGLSDFPYDDPSILGELTVYCSYSDNKRAGTFKVTLDGYDNPNFTYNYGTTTLIVKPAPLTVTPDDLSIVYGQTPSFAYSATGLVNNDTIDVITGTPNYATVYTAGSGVGSYDVNMDGLSSPNYKIAYGTGKLSVTPKPVTVTAKDADIAYGDSVKFEAIFDGLFGNDKLGGTLAFACDYASGKPIGTYVITPSGLDNANYTVAFANGTLRVAPRKVTVSVNDISVAFGKEDPEYGFTVSNLYNGDTKAALGTPVYGCAYTKESPVGSKFEITLSGLGNQNYDITVASGTLSVTEFAATVEWTRADSYVYNGKDQGSGISAKFKDANGNYVNATVVFGGKSATFKNAGAYTATATASEGYALSNSKIELTIAKANYSGITHPALGGTYDPSQNLSAYTLNEGFWWASSDVPTCDITEYSAYYNADSENYNDFALKITLKLEKATVTLNNPVVGVNYNGGPQLYTPILIYKGNTLNQSLYTPKYANNSNEQTAAGTYRIVLTIESENYQLPTTDCYFKIKGVLFNDVYYTIEDAIKEAAKGTIVVKYDTSFADANNNGCYDSADYYTVKSGVQLLVPYDEAGTTDTSLIAGTKGFLSLSDTNLGSVFRKLTMPNGTSLTVNGSININAKRGRNGTPSMGHTSENYGNLQMDEGSKITVNNGGIIYSNGYITGTGLIIAKNGAKIYDVLAVKDFRGGSVTTGIYQTVFPFNMYTFNNVEARIRFEYGSQLIAKYFFFIRLNIDGEINVIGKGSVFELSNESSYLEKFFNTSTGRDEISIYGDATTNYAQLSISGNKVSTQSLEFPLTGNLDISIKTGTFNLKNRFKLLPGATLTVSENAQVDISSGGMFYVYGGDGSDKQYQANYSFNSYSSAQFNAQTRTNNASFSNTSPAVFSVNGTLNLNGGTFGGIVRTSGTSGKIIANGTLTGTTKECEGNNKSNLPVVTFTAKAYLNGQVSTSVLSNNTTYIADPAGSNTWIIG